MRLSLPTERTRWAFGRVEPVLTRHLGAEGYVLGGGTVLAARWGGHRVSTDLDFFTDFRTFHEVYVPRMGKIAGDLIRAVPELGPRSLHYSEDGLLTELEACRISLSPTNVLTEPGISEQTVESSEVRAETDVEILAKKLGGRLVRSGVVVVRDLYDLEYASRAAPAALAGAMEALPPSFRQQAVAAVQASSGSYPLEPELIDPVQTFERAELCRRVVELLEAGPDALRAESGAGDGPETD